MNKKYFLILLVLIVSSRFLLVSKHPGDVDPAIYILSVQAGLNPTGNTTHNFNEELSFGYNALLTVVDRAVQHDVSKLVVILNYLNAAFGVFLILIFGLITKRLAGSSVSILGMLILLLDHSLWNWSLYGHPGILSVVIFLLSLYFFDKGIQEKNITDNTVKVKEKVQRGYLVLSGLTALASLAIRADIFLVFGVFALLYNHRRKLKEGWRVLVSFYGLTFFSFLVLLHIALGYRAIEIMIDRFLLPYRLGISSFKPASNVLLNLLVSNGLFAAGLGVLFFAAAIVSMVFLVKKSPKFLPLIILSVLPLLTLATRTGVDFARISIPLHPLFAFFAALFFSELSSAKKRLLWGIATVIIVYIAQTALVYYPLKKIWSRKFPPQPSIPLVIRPVPVGFFLTDRKNRWEDEKRLYQHALFLSQQKGNILVICSRLHFNRLAVLLLQLCPDADPIHRPFRGRIDTSTTSYRLIFRDRGGKDVVPKLFSSGLYRGYSVYYMNDIQRAYPVILLPEGYRLLQQKKVSVSDEGL